MISFVGEPLGRGFFNAPCATSGPGEYVFRRCGAMYAIIAAGGRQYKVSQGDVIYIDKVNQEADSAISFDVLMIGGEGDIRVGNPILAGAKVEGKVLAQVKGEKIQVYKYKSKKNYNKLTGHRQPYTKVEITAING